MHAFMSRGLAKGGMALGIVIIGGSAFAGIALATGVGRLPPDDPGSSVPLGNDSTPTTAPSRAAAEEAVDSAVRDSTDSPTDDQGERADEPDRAPPPSRPSPTPTCWDEDAPGERPDGIEDCEDEPDEH